MPLLPSQCPKITHIPKWKKYIIAFHKSAIPNQPWDNTKNISKKGAFTPVSSNEKCCIHIFCNGTLNKKYCYSLVLLSEESFSYTAIWYNNNWVEYDIYISDPCIYQDFDLFHYFMFKFKHVKETGVVLPCSALISFCMYMIERTLIFHLLQFMNRSAVFAYVCIFSIILTFFCRVNILILVWLVVVPCSNS